MQRDDVVDRIASFRRSTHSFFTVRVRALLALGTILALGTVGTFAAWANSAVATGTFSTGTVDLRANDTKSFTFSALGMTGMLPGESQAASLQVQNTRSTMDVTYTVNVTTPAGSPVLANNIQLRVFSGGTPSNATTGGLRTGSCTGTQIGQTTLAAGSAAPIVTSPRPLAASTGTETLCMVVTLPTTTPLPTQNQSVPALVFTFAAQTTV
ncbi:SipW-dependent-type signal peptide-containing protein [Rhodococcus rhodochrous]|uniref:Putative ribosomally synthesized peptide with SipW-like signal peptide n=1 Tax=Rhodococcus rhodochrous J45 TaxID=935266 RepID=A0A562E252_RHORH|nr:SipW-dependent-type signal peptide-containing protein [Rhodococcus rhodochrous]TWH15863.1 putative ribosomally synthesized peptide with SipW-like signal peptide [Rhodococcus rhodochrous J45]